MLIALGAVLGAELRYLLVHQFQRDWSGGVPWTTAFINITGSLVIGYVLSRVRTRSTGAQAIRLIVATGVLGSYTTFSTFSFETMTLIRHSEFASATTYVIISLVGGLACCWMGYRIGRQRPHQEEAYL
jgi:CrcB protein